MKRFPYDYEVQGMYPEESLSENYTMLVDVLCHLESPQLSLYPVSGRNVNTTYTCVKLCKLVNVIFVIRNKQCCMLWMPNVYFQQTTIHYIDYRPWRKIVSYRDQGL